MLKSKFKIPTSNSFLSSNTYNKLVYFTTKTKSKLEYNLKYNKQTKFDKPQLKFHENYKFISNIDTPGSHILWLWHIIKLKTK